AAARSLRGRPESPPPALCRSPPCPPVQARTGRTPPGRARHRQRRPVRGRRRPRAAAGSAARSPGRARGLVARLPKPARRGTRQVTPREVRTDVDAVRPVDPLLDWCAKRVQLREPRPLVVRQQHPDGFEPLLEPLRDALSELVEPLSRRSGNLERA